MNAFYFGNSDRALYGVHHPPRSQASRQTGVVLCYPFGQEYMRAHRAYRQLATLLARAGFNVLRFDYGATGDSAGSGEAASVEEWLADIGLAIDELRETASVSGVSLVGLRLGALLAAAAAATRDDVRDLVLWDPVASGNDYLPQMLAAAVPSEVEAWQAGGDPLGVMGFPLTHALHDGIGALDLLSITPPAGCRTLVVSSAERPEYRDLLQRLDRHGDALEVSVVPSPGSWNEVDAFGSALIPQAIIRNIVAFLTEGSEA